jgi:hypothetical protein
MKSSINAKNFIEFFEKECGVEFIDALTGERALDLIGKNAKEISKQICLNCKFAARNEEFVNEDLVCVNDRSPNVADFVFGDTSCNYWETKSGEC